MEHPTALNRYEQTWLRFTEELKKNPTLTLRTVCQQMHTNSKAMSKWVSRKGYSVKRAKSCMREPSNENPSSFVRIVPKEPPASHRISPLRGISITFNSGTTVSIRQGDAESIIRLISLYERKDGEPCIP